MGGDWEFILNLQIFKGHRVGWCGVGELISDSRLLPKGLPCEEGLVVFCLNSIAHCSEVWPLNFHLVEVWESIPGGIQNISPEKVLSR